MVRIFGREIFLIPFLGDFRVLLFSLIFLTACQAMIYDIEGRGPRNASSSSSSSSSSSVAESTEPTETKLSPSDGASLDLFSRGISISGTTAIVGAYGDDVGANSNQGSAYIYVFDTNTNTWDETKITASDGAANDFFGLSVAISGTSAIVGAYRDDVGANGDQGSAYIFVFDTNTNTWDETKITASDGAASDQFGNSVSISGTSAIVGAPVANVSQGSAYVYVFDTNTNTWDETKVTASDGAASDGFGFSVAISGTSAIVGSYGDDVGANGNQGSAYIYVFDTNTNTWDETKITSSDGAANDSFGYSASIFGTSAIIGAPGADVGANTNQGSAYIYAFDTNTNTWDETKITASDGALGDAFAYGGVSISGTSAIVGAYGDDDNGADAGSAYIYVFDTNTNTWDETKITASDGAANDQFGWGVSISGTTAIVGAFNDDDNGSNSGSAYFYDIIRKSSAVSGSFSEWQLTASDGLANDQLGISVSISGTSAIAGANSDDVGAANQGSAYIYIFDTNTNTWDETKITASDGAANDQFGWSVSISGTSAIVGSYRDDVGANSDQGSAYIFVFDTNTNTWDQTKITASDGAANDTFGQSVSISGTSAIVGSYGDNVGANSDQGSAYIFVFDTNTNTWDETKITASDGAANDIFGNSVSISGTSAIVGAHGDDDNGATSGSAYIYVFDTNTNTWDETKITASDGAASDYFGVSVSISGTSAIVGAYGDADNGAISGSAYIYVFDTNTNTWDETKIIASDGAALDFFGISVSISGLSAIIGANGHNVGANANQGSAYAYVFDTNTNTWNETKITSSDGAADDSFGVSVSISGTSTIVGAPYFDDGAIGNQGAAYINDYEY